ncbi:MAG: MBL fold metallo-hydrolase, partial [Verrucomicrobiia bacterium]
MKWTFYGAAQTTTGSRHVLAVNGTQLMVECGMFQGPRAESTERNSTFSFDPKTIDAAVVSHAHIDHTGALPTLVKRGFTGNIYATSATRDLSAVMLQDSAHVQRYDAEFVSRKRAKKGLPPVAPVYNEKEAEASIRQFVGLGYERPLWIADGVQVRFRDAGHILGSAHVSLDVREGSRKLRIGFSGDVGRGGDPLMRDPAPMEDLDVLLIEST